MILITRFFQYLEIIGSDLVTERPASRVYAYNDRILEQSEYPRRIAIVDLIDVLDFEIVISRTERAALLELPLLGVSAYA